MFIINELSASIEALRQAKKVHHCHFSATFEVNPQPRLALPEKVLDEGVALVCGVRSRTADPLPNTVHTSGMIVDADHSGWILQAVDST